MIGTNELLIIFGIVAVLFGGKKLPELARGIGKAKGELKKGQDEVNKEINEVKKDLNVDELNKGGA